MGNLPVIQEVGTSFQALGDHALGQPDKARERWDNYYKESVLGSLATVATERRKGNSEKAGKYLRGFGRAAGKALFGGGLLRDVPGFHELATCGESFGYVIGEGDVETARESWKTYLESSVIGAGIGMLAARKAGDLETAERRKQGFIRAGARFGVLGLSVAAAVATGGIAASYGVVVSAVAGAVVGGGIGAASTAATQIIDNGEVDLGAVIGNGLFGGALIAGNSLSVVTSNVWANNAAGTYPRGPTVPVEETDEETIQEKVKGTSDFEVNLFGSCELLLRSYMIFYIEFQSSHCMTQMIEAGLIDSAHDVANRLSILDERSTRFSIYPDQ